METDQILIIGDIIDHAIAPMTAQLLNIGKKLSDNLDKKINLVFIGDESLKDVEIGYRYGAHKVFKCSDPILGQYMAEPYLQALEQITGILQPAIILFGHNDMGLELAPRLAFRINTGVILDCIDVKIDRNSGSVEYIKPVFGGKAHAHYSITSTQPHIATIREGAFDPVSSEISERTDSEIGDAIPLQININQEKVKTIYRKKEIDENIALALKLASSSVVVCGGRGLKTVEGIDVIKETAELLDGAIAGSRPAIEYGWLSNTLQVGLTGKKVTPHIYIAVGISGALQHMAGCLKSKTIVAINTDESAQIFKFSHIGVIGNYQEVLKGFNDEVRRIEKRSH